MESAQIIVATLLEAAPYIVAIVGSVAMLMAAYLRYRKSPYEAVAVKSDAIQSLTDSVDTLTIRLSSERDARLQDCIEFEQNIADLRIELSRKYDTQLYDMKAYYEERINRLEQGHRDVVKVLKTRIRELENAVKNGNGGESQNPL
jgi:hypothetical protein